MRLFTKIFKTINGGDKNALDGFLGFLCAAATSLANENE